MGLPELHDVHEALMEKMSDHLKKRTVDPDKVMEMLDPSMKAGQQIMESVLQGMGSAMDAASQMDQDSKRKKLYQNDGFEFRVLT